MPNQCAESCPSSSENAPFKVATPKNAATLILLRRDQGAPRILMGQRGRGASFMPDKFVFPGGALDSADRSFSPARRLPERCAVRLAAKCAESDIGPALALAAIRETYEETGLILGAPDPGAVRKAPGAQGFWRDFLDRGMEPVVDRLSFIFRAITPPSLPKRFDARFFIADAAAVAGDPDDFSAADGELKHLNWLTLPEARALDLPFITGIVLAELEARIADGAGTEAAAAGNAPSAGRATPFFWHRDGQSYFDPL